ncbi:MarR family protein [Anopheles sinensis]|uniref:MarR family protein n=1 Tax=Anopheles sinensis TaxID=74873 RepID=A0A084VU91_ANOSI|nr:MarR family protein [Anopheles sinensis]
MRSTGVQLKKALPEPKGPTCSDDDDDDGEKKAREQVDNLALPVDAPCRPVLGGRGVVVVGRRLVDGGELVWWVFGIATKRRLARPCASPKRST